MQGMPGACVQERLLSLWSRQRDGVLSHVLRTSLLSFAVVMISFWCSNLERSMMKLILAKGKKS